MLDLKYRPLDFDSVVGSHAIVNLLRNRSRNRKLLERCLMFGGPKGCGKTSLARIVARASLCASLVDGNPCNKCSICVSHLKETCSSIIEFDAASSGTVDRIRSLVDDLEYSNIESDSTILILDEAHRLGPASQDALLKSMEERRLLVILCTTEPHKIRSAVRDRVDEFAIRPPTSTEMLERVKSICDTESISYSPEALSMVIEKSECGPRTVLNAISMLSSNGGVTVETVKTLYRYDSLNVLVGLMTSLSDRSTAYESWDYLTSRESIGWLRDNILEIISTGLRMMFGINPKVKYVPNFIDRDNLGFYRNIANRLAVLERPSISEVELILFSEFTFGNSSPSVNTPIQRMGSPKRLEPVAVGSLEPPKPVQGPEKSVPISVGLTGRSKPVEIDGVKFGSDEKLTSLHDRITPGRGPSIVIQDTEVSLGLDKSKIPMSEQEFSRAFFERTKS